MLLLDEKPECLPKNVDFQENTRRTFFSDNINIETYGITKFSQNNVELEQENKSVNPNFQLK